MENPHIDRIIKAIDEALQEPILSAEDLRKQDMILDMEYCINKRVEDGAITEDDGLIALHDYIVYLNTPEEQQRIIDPNQGVLFVVPRVPNAQASPGFYL